MIRPFIESVSVLTVSGYKGVPNCRNLHNFTRFQSETPASERTLAAKPRLQKFARGFVTSLACKNFFGGMVMDNGDGALMVRDLTDPA